MVSKKFDKFKKMYNDTGQTEVCSEKCLLHSPFSFLIMPLVLCPRKTA